MKIWVDKDEWYPVYTLDTEEGFGDEREAPDSLVEEYAAAMKAFDAVQAQLHTLYGD